MDEASSGWKLPLADETAGSKGSSGLCQPSRSDREYIPGCAGPTRREPEALSDGSRWRVQRLSALAMEPPAGFRFLTGGGGNVPG